jgi:hypothetical protein
MPSRSSTAFVCVAAIALFALPAVGVRADTDSLTPAQRSLRILELEADIRSAREQLADLISGPASTDAVPLREQPELREVAEILAKIAEELSELRADAARPITVRDRH